MQCCQHSPVGGQLDMLRHEWCFVGGGGWICMDAFNIYREHTCATHTKAWRFHCCISVQVWCSAAQLWLHTSLSGKLTRQCAEIIFYKDTLISAPKKPMMASATESCHALKHGKLDRSLALPASMSCRDWDVAVVCHSDSRFKQESMSR